MKIKTSKATYFLLLGLRIRQRLFTNFQNCFYAGAIETLYYIFKKCFWRRLKDFEEYQFYTSEHNLIVF